MQALERDYHNFSQPSAHRLPTISGIEAISNAVQNSRPISTNLASLDTILGSSGPDRDSPQNGLRRGQITEVFGPPGVGKTTFALQVAVQTLIHKGYKVTWLSNASPLVPSRLHALLRKASSPTDDDSADIQPDLLRAQRHMLDNLKYLQITSLPELLALIIHPKADFPPPGTSLVVLDDLSNLLLSSLPRVTKAGSAVASQLTPTQIRSDHAYKQAVSRRTQVISGFASALQAFAASRNAAVLVTSKASINLKNAQKAMLRSALSSQQWDAFLGFRIALFRDFWPNGFFKDDKTQDQLPSSLRQRTGLRYCRIQRLNGKDISTPQVGFIITEGGLQEVISPVATVIPQVVQPSTELGGTSDEPEQNHGINYEYDVAIPDESDSLSITAEDASHPGHLPVVTRKRKVIEIADSDDEVGSESRALDFDSSAPLPDPNFQGTHQVHNDNTNEDILPKFQTAKNLQMNESQPREPSHEIDCQPNSQASEVNQGNDEMLLDQFEERPVPPPFSQAAANMSDPLTPSDDGCRSS